MAFVSWGVLLVSIGFFLNNIFQRRYGVIARINDRVGRRKWRRIRRLLDGPSLDCSLKELMTMLFVSAFYHVIGDHSKNLRGSMGQQSAW